jgi:hypothetical protein
MWSAVSRTERCSRRRWCWRGAGVMTRAGGLWAAPFRGLALVSAVALAVFASRIAGPCNGVVQRIAVTLALAAEILIAGRMLTLPVAGSAAGPGVTPGQGAPASQGG